MAYNGVVRPSPLADTTAAMGNGGATSSPNPSPGVASGTSSSVIASTLPNKPQLLEQAAQNPQVLDALPDQEADSILDELLAAGLIATGAYTAYKLYRRQKNPASLMNASSVPAISDLPPDMNARPVIDMGELTPVRDSLTSAVAERALPKPPNSLPRPPASLENFSGPAPASRAEVGARQATQSRVLPDSGNMIHLPDAMGDISDSEYRQAVTLRDQIIADRVRGRRDLMRGRAGGPTADINPEGVLNEIIALIRKNRNVSGALRRIR